MPVTFAVHNLCHDLGKQAVKEDLNKSAEHASVGLIQERSFDAGKAAFSDFRDRDGISPTDACSADLFKSSLTACFPRSWHRL